MWKLRLYAALLLLAALLLTLAFGPRCRPDDRGCLLYSGVYAL